MRRGVWITGAIFAFVIVGVIARYFATLPPKLDGPILRVLEQIAYIDSYTQIVETEVTFPSRLLQISGTYYNNEAEGRFATLSTTTLSMLDQPDDLRSHSFTHENIAIENDIYTRIQTDSPILRKSIKNGKEWWHFHKGSIPKPFENIAIAGPILDSLMLLSEGGKYITLLEKHGVDLWGDKKLLRYTFKTSNITPSVDGALKALVARIGKDGTIDVWIDETEPTVKYLVFKNDGYHSTTTISGINNPHLIAPPPTER